jgi:hypothetical protein
MVFGDEHDDSRERRLLVGREDRRAEVGDPIEEQRSG